jgi:predicted Co/Zn/Cd cation transporter (cation efflux family)
VRPAPAVVSYPPVATAPREEGDGDQTRRLRRVTVLLTVLIGLVGLVIGLLVGRR